MTLVAVGAVGAAGCSAPRPPRQAGVDEELHASVVAKKMLASSDALAPAIPLANPRDVKLAAATDGDGLPERLLNGVSRSRSEDYVAYVSESDADRSATIEVDDLPNLAAEKTAVDERTAQARAKAKADRDKRREREMEADRAKSEAEAQAAKREAEKREAEKREAEKREVARAEAEKARARASGPLLGSGPDERGTRCDCEPGDPLCGCL